MSRATLTRARIKLRRILTETNNNVKPAMRDSANLLHKEMVRRVPKDTGNLAQTITAYVAKNGLRAEVGFRGKKGRRAGFYARFVEFGTKGHKVEPKKLQMRSGAQVLSDGSQVYGRSANIPALPPRPFMAPTWDTKKPDVVSRVAKAINDAVKSAQVAR